MNATKPSADCGRSIPTVDRRMFKIGGLAGASTAHTPIVGKCWEPVFPAASVPKIFGPASTYKRFGPRR
jgi:hypothetical protein